MVTKRLIIALTFNFGVLYRTRNFLPDYRYTSNFIDTWSVDEIVVLDITRNKDPNSEELFNKKLDEITTNCFVPLTVGGGIKNIEDVKKKMRLGADKVALNTAVIENPKLISEISNSFGSQAVVCSIDFKKKNDNYEVVSNNGSLNTGLCPIKWAKKVEKLGAGEILLTSVDRDGFLGGYEIDICKIIKNEVNIPVIILGGCGNWGHMYEAFNVANVDGVCTQNVFHFTEKSLKSAKDFLKKKNIYVRG